MSFDNNYNNQINQHRCDNQKPLVELVIENSPLFRKKESFIDWIFDLILTLNCVVYTILAHTTNDPTFGDKLMTHTWNSIAWMIFYFIGVSFLAGLLSKLAGYGTYMIVNSALIYVNYNLMLHFGIDPIEQIHIFWLWLMTMIMH